MGWDVLLDSDGDLPKSPQLVRDDDPRIITQRARLRLGTHRGEWVLDILEGLPFLDWSSRKPAPLLEIRALVQRELETIPGVDRVLDLQIEQQGQRVILTGQVYLSESEDELQAQVTLGGEGNSRAVAVFYARSGGVV